MDVKDMNITQDMFTFTNSTENLHDKELVTKPVSYLKDAWNRFKRNKASIVASFIILILVLFAIIGPFCSQYSVGYEDAYFRYALPRLDICYENDLGFWDGFKEKDLNSSSFHLEYAKGVETGHNAIKNQEYSTFEKEVIGKNGKVSIETFYHVDFDTYQDTGMIFKDLPVADYLALQEYQNKTGIQIIYPMTQEDKLPKTGALAGNANVWYATKKSNGLYIPKGLIENDDGTFDYVNIYEDYHGDYDKYDSIRIEGETPIYSYALKMQNGSSYRVRLCYYEYYRYIHSEVKKDGIDKPSFIFGANSVGKDNFVNLAGGARFSFIFAIVVAVINLIVGAIIGAIEGYYGGKIDIIMERFIEILSSVPFMIVITLLKYHMKGSSQLLILFIAFFLTGWIGTAGRTRMQFYRFKNQEYVLAARTLGAKDSRIMFKHIFPNALGTLITGSVLVIPGMIFSETSLSYLGIINLSTGDLTSVGTLLAQGQKSLNNAPHIVLFPSIFISLLMLSFNLFGNGLRDAFNPSLRGSE